MSQKPLTSQSIPFVASRMRMGAIAAISLIGVVGLAGAFSTPAVDQTVNVRVAEPSFGVTSLNITGSNTGNAIIKLDEFSIAVTFEYHAFEDSYGVQGSEFTAVDLTSLEIDSITDSRGEQYLDFTNHADIINIKNLIVAYIEKNNLAEA